MSQKSHKRDDATEPAYKKPSKKAAAKKEQLRAQAEIESDDDNASDYTNKFNIDNIIEPVKPSKSLTTYMFFANQVRADRDMSVKCDVGELMKKASAEWKQLTDKDKEPYVKLNEADKKRYENEMRQFEARGYFINKDGVSSLDLALRNPKFKPDVVTPKRISTSYQCFMKTQFDIIKADVLRENLDAKLPDVSAKISELWSAMSDKQKQPYIDQQDKDRERFEGQLQELFT